jgi:hypothetical protein
VESGIRDVAPGDARHDSNRGVDALCLQDGLVSRGLAGPL